MTNTSVDLAPVSVPPLGGADPAASPRPPVERDRYIDSLRALALIRVVGYHLFGWAWLTVIFPSIPIMFALAGALVAGSLDRSPMNPWAVLAKRVRRLLPPLWLLGAVAVPLMLLNGWTYDSDSGLGSALDWKTLLFWIVPISDPPGSIWGLDFTVPLWYLRAYLWFLILSPALLWLFRRWPARTLAVPFIGILAATAGLWDLSGPTGDVILTLMTYGTCWMLGFAHHDNLIRTTPLRKVIPVALAFMAIGLTYALTHQRAASGYDLDEIPLAIAFWGTGAVLLLLRLYPDFSWMRRMPVLDKLVAAINARAMTIYLWNNPAIALSGPLAQLFSVTRGFDDEGVVGKTQQFLVTWVLIVVAILLFGWVEDVAAKRGVRINPWPRTRRTTGPQSKRSRARLLPVTIGGALVAALATVVVFASVVGWQAVPAKMQRTGDLASSLAVSRAADSFLPRRVVAGYWQGWGNPAIRLGNVPDSFNVVMVSFAVADGASGKVKFAQSVQPQDTFVADVDKLTDAGRKVVLSVGGADDGGLKITTDQQRQAFLDSIVPIIDANHFQGVDWDLEHGLDPVQVAETTHALKARYGPQFIVTMTPTLTEKYEKQQRDLAGLIKDDLNFVAPQFYNGGETDPEWIVDRALEWVEIVGEPKVVMGFMTTKTATDKGILTPEAACSTWAALLGLAPQARGLMTWSVNLDQTTGYSFARQCAPLVATS